MEDLLAQKVLITDLSRFRKVIDLRTPEPVGLPSGHISREELKKIPAGGSFEVRDKRYFVLPCDMNDFVMEGLKRNTQIVYPKDSGYILMKLDIFPGKRIAEAGTGSGAMTAVFSRAVGSGGRVYSYEQDIGLINHAVKNLELDAGDTNVIIHHQSLELGIYEQDLDAFFLDVREPWKYLGAVYDCLKPGSHLGILVPTANQVSRVLLAFNNWDFLVTEVAETFLRTYKPVPARLRPMDRMIGHTSYLIFARTMQPDTIRRIAARAAPASEDGDGGLLPENGGPDGA
ncbi:MAG TPA: tRNA (adenine-N1)-methyltransferase [Deltaproteobacteria bacterium]|nr:tRNA (adenine-N1)-methyltransferase [Deltaproteobacteria bacterium]